VCTLNTGGSCLKSEENPREVSDMSYLFFSILVWNGWFVETWNWTVA
jgi:hypothetical protein